MLVSEAQYDLRRAYVGGGPGVVISGMVWLVAAWTQHNHGISAGFAALFFGGILIFPASKILCRVVFRRANESSTNPFGMTVLESTLAMIGGLFAAWLFLASTAALVFPLAAIAVGTHYLIFKTVYGDRTFWLLASIVTAIGLADIFISRMHGSTALLVAITELALGLAIATRALSASKPASTAMS